MEVTQQQLQELIEAYCDRCVDDMSYKEMGQILFEMMVDSFSNYSPQEMMDTIKTIYDESYLNSLCEEVGIDASSM